MISFIKKETLCWVDLKVKRFLFQHRVYYIYYVGNKIIKIQIIRQEFIFILAYLNVEQKTKTSY